MTQAERREHNKKKALCIAAIIHDYYIEQQKMHDEGKNHCVSKGFLKNLICKKKKEFGLDDDCYIRDKTIHFRVQNKIFTVDCFWVHHSPLKDLKDTIVNILIEMS